MLVAWRGVAWRDVVKNTLSCSRSDRIASWFTWIHTCNNSTVTQLDDACDVSTHSALTVLVLVQGGNSMPPTSPVLSRAAHDTSSTALSVLTRARAPQSHAHTLLHVLEPVLAMTLTFLDIEEPHSTNLALDGHATRAAHSAAGVHDE